MDKHFQLTCAVAVACIAGYSLYLGNQTLAATCAGGLIGVLNSLIKGNQPVAKESANEG